MVYLAVQRRRKKRLDRDVISSASAPRLHSLLFMHIARALAHDPHVREKPWRRGATALDSDDMTNPPVYRAHSIPDLLNVVPTLFGFVPEESFIGICVSGPRRKF